MTQRNEPSRLPKWPFIFANTVLIALAYLIFARQRGSPLTALDVTALVVLGTLGGLFSIAPFILEYRASVKLLESSGLVSTVREIRNLELLAVQINAATARWQVVQEHSGNSLAAAKDVADKMASEASAFTESLAKANDTEKSNLKLEVEKLRRLEGEWLQIITRLLDHTFALYKAAERSGQPGLIDQLGRFLHSCQDVARRIGLVPFHPDANELFDPQWHHTQETGSAPVAGAKVSDTIACGYTYQGRMIRPALVVLQNRNDGSNGAETSSEGAVGREEPVAEQTLL